MSEELFEGYTLYEDNKCIQYTNKTSENYVVVCFDLINKQVEVYDWRTFDNLDPRDLDIEEDIQKIKEKLGWKKLY